MEALEAHNEATDPKGNTGRGPPSEWLRNAVKGQVWQ